MFIIRGSLGGRHVLDREIFMNERHKIKNQSRTNQRKDKETTNNKLLTLPTLNVENKYLYVNKNKFDNVKFTFKQKHMKLNTAGETTQKRKQRN